MAPEELVYLHEFLASDMHWCRLLGGPIAKMGMLVEVPKNQHIICIPHITEVPATQDYSWSGKCDGGSTSTVIKKLRYVRNPVNRTQFDFQG